VGFFLSLSPLLLFSLSVCSLALFCSTDSPRGRLRCSTAAAAAAASKTRKKKKEQQQQEEQHHRFFSILSPSSLMLRRLLLLFPPSRSLRQPSRSREASSAPRALAALSGVRGREQSPRVSLVFERERERESSKKK